jgi:hypothetical protein
MKKPVSRIIIVFFFGVFAGCFSGACGMEDYIYLDPVQESSITVRLTEDATLKLPFSIPEEVWYFTHFSIFYRIYISGIPQSSAITSPELMRTINTALYSDYNSIYPSTSSAATSTSVNTNIASLFSNLKYYELELEGENIQSVLGAGSQGQELRLQFPPQPGSIPVLVLGGGGEKRLYRSTGDGLFNPQPNRYFVNASELNASVNATTTGNADVADQSGISGKRYAYVSMYIAKVGRDSNTFANIYSAPTFIGILSLPDP